MMETNGEVRQKVYDANGKFTYRWTFAGNANTFENGIGLNDESKLNIQNFDFVMEGMRRNKILGRRKKKNEKGRNE